jgi:hypothetical protein
MRVGFHHCQPQNAIHFLSHGKDLFNFSKTGETQLSNAARMRLEDDLHQSRKETGSITTLNELVHNLM